MMLAGRCGGAGGNGFLLLPFSLYHGDRENTAHHLWEIPLGLRGAIRRRATIIEGGVLALNDWRRDFFRIISPCESRQLSS